MMQSQTVGSIPIGRPGSDVLFKSRYDCFYNLAILIIQPPLGLCDTEKRITFKNAVFFLLLSIVFNDFVIHGGSPGPAK